MKSKILWGLLVLVVFSACRKSPNLNALQNQQVVVTDRDLEAKFNNFTTYHISDTVRVIRNSPIDSFLTGPIAQQLVTTVRNNMNSRGYTHIGSKSANPEMALELVILKDVGSVTTCAGWWGGGWGGWGMWHPWCGSFQYTIGTSVLTLYDLKNAELNNAFRAMWGMTAFGVFSNTNQNTNLNLTNNAINQAFSQSPYIKR